jgi:hypothetical protein
VGKRNLPVLDRVFGEAEAEAGAERGAAPNKPKRPSVDAARKRLGGRVDKTDRGAPPAGLTPGSFVDAPGADGAREIAVVLFATASEAHVLLDGARLRRLPHASLARREGAPASSALVKVAADARVFAMLVEGQAVRYADSEGELRAGRLVEKCRYGALVLRDHGAIVAVGFR